MEKWKRREPGRVTQTIPRRPLSEPCPASFAQRRLWFLHQLDPDSSAYTITVAFRFAGTLDRGALEHSLRAIIEREVATLGSDKTDRAALAALFGEVALRLTNEFKIPGDR